MKQNGSSISFDLIKKDRYKIYNEVYTKDNMSHYIIKFLTIFFLAGKMTITHNPLILSEILFINCFCLSSEAMVMSSKPNTGY